MTSDRNDIYQNTRDDLLKRQLSNDENLDRSLLTLSSAALALSIAFLRYTPDASEFSLLIISWILFVLTIVSTLASFFVSQHAISVQLKLAQRYYVEEDEKALHEENVAATWTERIKYFSGGTFVVAIILLLIFFAINVNSKEKKPMADERPVQRIQEGATVPKLQKIDGGASIPKMQIAPTDERAASIPPLQPVPASPPRQPEATTTPPPEPPPSQDE